MTTDLATLRAQAKEHAKQIEAVLWLSASELAVRWGVSTRTVLRIPRAELPYLQMAGSRTRRYNPYDVERYESSSKHGSDAP